MSSNHEKLKKKKKKKIPPWTYATIFGGVNKINNKSKILKMNNPPQILTMLYTYIIGLHLA